MLSAENLSFAYDRRHPVLTDWSHDFTVGQVTSITGPSGRGKSTLLYLLGLMLAPTSGRVAIKGTTVSHLRDSARASLRATSFGFVFQDAALDPGRSVIDNVVETALYRAESRATAVPRGHELLDRFGVEVRADARPGQISGGQAQRIALCRALHSRPSILLADEPTGNLDREASIVVMDALRDAAAAGAVVVVVTHDPTAIMMSDCELRL